LAVLVGDLAIAFIEGWIWYARAFFAFLFGWTKFGISPFIATDVSIEYA
jgi:hypothetical protein